MLQTQHWEHHLIDLATSVLDGDSASQNQPVTNSAGLSRAYQYCETITKENSRTFYAAARLLPYEKRQATYALYALCRVSDDMVDHPHELDQPNGAHSLEEWRRQVCQEEPVRNAGVNTGVSSSIHEYVRLAWADARRRYEIPRGYVDQLIDGLKLDFKRVRYSTFTDLSRYCYGVACTVGLMSMCITGYEGREAFPYAIRLGVALQLTNILRDIGEDWRAGRLYLPQEELAAFGLEEADIEAGRVDQRWREFMRYQISRARRLYEEALPGVALLHADGRFAIAAAGELYRAILDRIEQNDYDVFHYRASTTKWEKIRRLPGIWWRANRMTIG